VEVCPTLQPRNVTLVEDSWTAKSEQIRAVSPDLVIASVPYQIEAVAEILKCGAQFLGLAPRTLHDIYADISTIARVLNRSECGDALITEMRAEIERVRARSSARTFRPKVYCEEWGKPLIHSQPWVAELVTAAGGEFVGEAGKQVDADSVRRLNPDVIITAWCGAGNRVPLEKIVVQRGWEALPAVREGRVYCINDEFLNTPGPTLIRGLYALDAAITDVAAPGLRRLNSTRNSANVVHSGPGR
jgi:iron complex transport system substrate-binding protein